MTYVIFGVFVAGLCSVFCAEIPENTCPYFSYLNSEYNYLYGRLILPNDGRGHYDLSISASIRGAYESLPDLSITLVTPENDIYAGANLEYWIYFPFWDNIPKITMVTLNGNMYCSGLPFSVEYGMGVTTMWSQYVYSLGTQNTELMWAPTPTSNQIPSQPQYTWEVPTPPEDSPETPVILQNRPLFPTSTQESSNVLHQSEYFSVSDKDQDIPVTTYQPQLYTSNVLIESQYSFELLESSEDAVEGLIPLKNPPKVPAPTMFPPKAVPSYDSPPYTSKMQVTPHYSFQFPESSEDSTEESPQESPLLLSQLVPTQSSRQKPMQPIEDSDANLTSFLQNCGASIGDNTGFRIFNGKPTVEGQYPWLAALLLYDGSIRGSYKCVANLISEKHLLTAAHCVSHFAKEDLLLQFHSSEATDAQPVYEYFRSVIDVQISPFYITEPFGDVALLTINQSVVSLSTTIKPICLWSGGKELDYTGTVAGWGLDENEDSGIGNAKAIDISMVASSKCIETYGLESDYRLFSDYCFCTAHINAMPCRGDSGAGFMVNNEGRYFLRGIVSVGYRFCGRSSYTIFVDLVPHLNWITRSLDFE